MKKERIIAKSVREPAEKMWSNCLKVGNQLFVSGLTARADDGETILGDNEYEQATVVFQKIKDLLEAGGAQIDDVVKMTIFVTNIKNNKGVWQARQAFFNGDFPACTLVEVRALAKPEILLEIEATAILGCGN